MALPETILLLLASAAIRPEDIRESFARSSGPGGQNVNKVSTGVRLLHLPTQTSVHAQDARSQSVNRMAAYRRLVSAIAKKVQLAKNEKKAAREKERRQNRKRPHGLKRKILDGKKKRGNLKVMRRKPSDEI